MKKVFVAVLGAVLLGTGCGDDGSFADNPSEGDGRVGACDGADSESVSLDEEEQRLLELINEHRAANGAPPLAACRSLSRAAQRHSEDMRDRDYFDHTGLDGSTPRERMCDACFESCQSTGFGENIAPGNADAQGTFEQWRGSSGHNRNMLDERYVVIGIGRATGGGTYGAYWTNVFAGSSDPSCGD